MKMKKLSALLVGVAFLASAGLALASGGNELAYYPIQQLTALANNLVTSGDYIPVYDASTNTVKKVDATRVNGLGAGSDRVVNVTASTLALTQATHAGKVVTLNRAGGIAVTLPAATGSGDVYQLEIGTTFTSNLTVTTASGSDTMNGQAWVMSDNSAAVLSYDAAGTATVITQNGTTQGGYIGGYITLRDVASGKWFVNVTGKATGTEATPFS